MTPRGVAQVDSVKITVRHLSIDAAVFVHSMHFYAFYALKQVLSPKPDTSKHQWYQASKKKN